MANGKSNLAENAMEAAVRWAQVRFAGQPNRDELIADAVSAAWEGSLTAGPDATPSTVAEYAVRHVATGEHLYRGRKSIDDSRPLPKKPIRQRRQLSDAATDCNDPAVIAAFRIDTAEWMQTLPIRQLLILRAILNGHRTQDVARKFQLSPGRISQIRRELSDSYREFVAAE